MGGKAENLQLSLKFSTISKFCSCFAAIARSTPAEAAGDKNLELLLDLLLYSDIEGGNTLLNRFVRLIVPYYQTLQLAYEKASAFAREPEAGESEALTSVLEELEGKISQYEEFLQQQSLFAPTSHASYQNLLFVHKIYQFVQEVLSGLSSQPPQQRPLDVP